MPSRETYPNGKKRCKRCKTTKPVEGFDKVYSELHYRQPQCKPCRRVMRKEWLVKKRAEARARLGKGSVK